MSNFHNLATIAHSLLTHPAWCLPVCRLFGNNIGPEGAKALAPALAANASLTKLVVWGNMLDREGEAALRKAVEGRSGFELGLP
jgi:hypothetical protein